MSAEYHNGHVTVSHKFEGRCKSDAYPFPSKINYLFLYFAWVPAILIILIIYLFIYCFGKHLN